MTPSEWTDKVFAELPEHPDHAETLRFAIHAAILGAVAEAEIKVRADFVRARSVGIFHDPTGDGNPVAW